MEQLYFDKIAKDYDKQQRVYIPKYDEILKILVSMIPFNKNKKIRVLDLGCGTGNLSLQILKSYPNARVTCLDLSKEMLNVTKEKLRKYKNQVKFIHRDFGEESIRGLYDVILSSFAIHHLTNYKKRKLFKEIYESLKFGGCFFNADIVLTDSKILGKMYEKILDKYPDKTLWSGKILKERIKKSLIAMKKFKHKEKETDIPAKLEDQIRWFKDVGFSDVDCVWKYLGIAIYGGYKIKK